MKKNKWGHIKSEGCKMQATTRQTVGNTCIYIYMGETQVVNSSKVVSKYIYNINIVWK